MYFIAFVKHDVLARIAPRSSSRPRIMPSAPPARASDLHELRAEPIPYAIVLGGAAGLWLFVAAVLAYQDVSSAWWMTHSLAGALGAAVAYTVLRQAAAQAEARYATQLRAREEGSPPRRAEVGGAFTATGLVASPAEATAAGPTTRTDHGAEARSGFYAGVSTDLRTDLSAIVGYAEMLAEEARDGGYDDLAPDLARIRAAAERLLTVVNDTLDFARLDAGLVHPAFNPVDLGQLLDAASAAATPLAERHGHRLVVQRQPLGVMTTDPARLQQIAMGLLTSAARQATSGTVVLAARRTPDHGLVLVVRATESEMTEARAEELLHPFARPRGAALQAYGETGLEVALALRSARLLGGDLTAEGQAGRGATFTLTLPDRADDAPASAPRMDTYFPDL